MLALTLAILIFVAGTALLWVGLSHGLPGGYRHFRSIAVRLAKPFTDRMRTSRHAARVEPYVPLLVVIAIGFAVIFFAGDAFLDLVEELQRESDALRSADQAVYDAFNGVRTGGLTQFFTFFTVIGTPVGLGAITVIAAIYFLRERRPRLVLYLGVATITGSLLNLALKHHFSRPRPDLELALRDAHGHSFPSGHAMGSIIVFGALSYLAIRSAKSWRLSSAFFALAITTVLTISLSRIYLGVHWVSDISAGLAIGLVWVVTCTIVYEISRRLRAAREAASRAAADSRKSKVEESPNREPLRE